MNRREDASVSITSARISKSADIRTREVRYLISMGIRTACFVAAIIVDGPLRWILIAAAFVLPYFAVVMANAGDRTGTRGPEPFGATHALESDEARALKPPVADGPRNQG